ncbi:hypothetical protein D3C81_2120030 [compost metagenome]
MEKVSGLKHESGLAGIHSAVVGSMMFMTWEMRLAGNPLTRACSLICSSFGEMYTQ